MSELFVFGGDNDGKLPKAHLQILSRAPSFWKLLLANSSEHMHRLLPAALVAAGVHPAHFVVGNTTNTFVLDLRRHYDRGVACFLLEWNRSMRKRLSVHGYGL